MAKNRAFIMALNIPDNANQIVQRSKTAVQRALPTSNPFLPNSWLSALITAFSFRVYDFYLQLREAVKQTFWNTSTGQSLEEQASWFKIVRLAATRSTGHIVVTGTAGASVPANTLLNTSDGLEFKVTATASISAKSVSVTSITRAGAVATAVLPSEHNLAGNVPVTLSGANEAQFNGTFAIQVTDSNKFTFPVPDSGAMAATGTLLASFTSGLVAVQSVDFGQQVNLPLDAVLTLQSPLAGVNDDAHVNFEELAGGTDQETDDQLRTRFLERVQNPVAHFNVAEITTKAKEINGVTRVFVQEITPEVGQVTIYFTRDNDENIIPTAPEIAAVKNQILTIKPANTADADVIVLAPDPVPVNFVFGSISPNTAAMKDSVQANLLQFFLEKTSVGEDVLSVAYNSAIFQTVDSSGQRIESFTLSAPVGNIAVVSGEIATLGTVTIP